jgi:hypothetical protein
MKLSEVLAALEAQKQLHVGDPECGIQIEGVQWGTPVRSSQPGAGASLMAPLTEVVPLMVMGSHAFAGQIHNGRVIFRGKLDEYWG